MHLFRQTVLGLLAAVLCAVAVAKTPPRHASAPAKYIPARPALGGIHLAMSQDSAEMMLSKIALRQTRLALDSMTLIESDSVRIFGESAYMRLEILHGRVRTLVINFHPLSGDHYLNTRDMAQKYLEGYFGGGVNTHNESVLYRRWENEDGTMEVTISDKYMRVFIRLGKQ